MNNHTCIGSLIIHLSNVNDASYGNGTHQSVLQYSSTVDLTLPRRLTHSMLGSVDLQREPIDMMVVVARRLNAVGTESKQTADVVVAVLRYYIRSNTTTIANNSGNNMTKKKTFEEDCIRPACDDIKDMMQHAKAASASATTASSKPSLTTTATATTATQQQECPPGSAELGRSSWTLLHSMVRTCCVSMLHRCIWHGWGSGFRGILLNQRFRRISNSSFFVTTSFWDQSCDSERDFFRPLGIRRNPPTRIGNT
jgi:hypothetical protein